MSTKASNKKKRPVRPLIKPASPALQRRWWQATVAASALLWFIVATATASRVHFVMGYRVLAGGPPQLEPFLASYWAWGFAFLAMLSWCAMAAILLSSSHAQTEAELAEHPRAATVRWALGGLAMAWLPLLLAMLLRARGAELQPGYWEPLWLATWSGISFAWLIQQCAALPPRDCPSDSSLSSLGRWGLGRWSLGRWSLGSWKNAQWKWNRGRVDALRGDLVAIVAACGVACIGWTWQSHTYYSNFQLGFNDFGHFAQRVANTAGGRGLLLESPVLPTFWDHFNPGLLLLVPLWSIFPSVYLFFVLQSVALASGGIFVWGIARQQGLGRLAGLLFGLAWLAQPVLGQMNVAYTYGWHPISLAIPLLLAAIWALTAHRQYLALALAVLAMSMEEGVIVIVCLFCGVSAVSKMWPLRTKASDASVGSRAYGLPAAVWLLLAVTCGLSFVLVYRFSGIAEFQTARFATLGSTTAQVLLSPLLRPAEFWGSLFRWQKLYFLLSLWIPCFMLSLLRGWRTVLATALPLLVLLVWDHRPATSLAFQYASTLLPVFWLATIQGTRAYAAQPHGSLPAIAQSKNSPVEVKRYRSRAAGAAGGALATGLILSLFVGQLIYSSPTLLDVIAFSYGATDTPHQRRQAGEEDGQWLTGQVQRIQRDGSAVLATGRIAAHFVGNSDVETVGQYLLRRPQLAALADRRDQPIAHYRWIILDRREGFQQTSAEIATVEAEARQAGFQTIADRFDVIVMQRDSGVAPSGT